jgi:hypothetical protein
VGLPIVLQPPYILIESGESTQGNIAVNNIGQFGVVFQVNASTTICAEGDTIFYIIENQAAIQKDIDGAIYFSIDETKIIFVENAP